MPDKKRIRVDFKAFVRGVKRLVISVIKMISTAWPQKWAL